MNRNMAVRPDRHAGVLLHLSSLPGAKLGEDGLRFVRFLRDAGFTVWQMLPTGPIDKSGSPYTSTSAFAGNPDFVDWQGFLRIAEPCAPERAFTLWRRSASTAERSAFDDFVDANHRWLHEYALFAALRDAHKRPWVEWPVTLRRRESSALASSRRHLRGEIELKLFEQFAFSCQWLAFRSCANDEGVLLFGDVPFFVAHDSVDVWAHQPQFQLDEDGMPTVVAGVPPDYFSETGQRWGNPVYDWSQMATDGYAWWGMRIANMLAQFDMVRIDHFRALDAYWEIPASSQSAREGRWVETPGSALLEDWIETYGEDRLIAEDLGHITETVEALRDRFGMRGMRVLQFGFDGDADNPHLLHNHIQRAAVFTGTHDNDTTLGWYRTLADTDRRRVDEYLGHPSEPMPWPMIRAAMRSVATLAMVPLQDLLSLDSEARMNVPGTTERNWQWRFDWDQIPPDLASHMHEMLLMYGRI